MKISARAIDANGLRIFGFVLTALMVAWYGRADAASLLPLATQEVQTLPSGTIEAVLGVSYLNNPRFPLFTPPGTYSSQELVSAPGIGLNIGAGGWAEIQASFEMLYLNETFADGSHRSEYGNGDARLFTKVRALKEGDWYPAIGARFGTKLPNANKEKGLGTDEIDFGIEALLSKQLGPITAHANLGIALLDNPGPPILPPGESASGQDDLFTYAVALVSPSLLGDGVSSTALRFLGEAVGLAGSRFDNDRAAVRLGAQVERGGFTFYLGSSVGLESGSEDFGFSGGLFYTFELERLFGRDD